MSQMASEQDATSIRVRFKESNWPSSLPHPKEECFLTVICGNTHIGWAMHRHFLQCCPSTCWMTYAESIGTKLLLCLQRDVTEVLWPTSAGIPHSRHSLAAYRNTKRIPFLTVYLISTNTTNEEKLASLFEGLPCRLIRLKASDFYDPLPYSTIGLDRLAAAKGVGTINIERINNKHRPVMLVDGGTAMTITFLDRQGRILNGCITPGLGAKFRSMHEATGKLPHITPNEVQLAWSNRVADRSDDNDDTASPDRDERPLTAFADNTREAMLAGVLKEVASFLNTMASDWVEGLQQECQDGHGDDDDNNNKEDELPAPLIVVTGTDGPILADLMSPDRCQRIIRMKPKDIVNVEVKQVQNLVHRGMAQVVRQEREKLDAKLKQTENGSCHQDLRNELIGQRVAKVFDGVTNEFTGDSTFYGVIVSITSASDDFDDAYFSVQYDDNGAEDLDILEVYDALKLYAVKGERYKTRFDTRPKVEGARACAKLLAKHSDAIRSTEQEGSPPLKRLRSSPAEPTASAPEAGPNNDEGPATEADDDAQSPAKAEYDNNTEHKVTTAKDDDDNEDKEETRPNSRGTAAHPGKEAGEQEEEEEEGEDLFGGQPVAKSGATEDYVGRRIAKFFGNDLYCGTITEKRGDKLWFVVYEDDDSEEFDEKEVLEYTQLFVDKFLPQTR